MNVNIWDESQIICTWHIKSNLCPRKQATFCNSTTAFPAKWLLRKDCRDSLLMMCQSYPALGARCMCFLIGWKCALTIQEHYPDLLWHIPIISMEFLCSFPEIISRGYTTGGIMKCYLKEIDNDAMLLCNSIHFRLKTLFGTSRTDALKLHPNQ